MADVGNRDGRPAQRDEPSMIELEMVPVAVAQPRPRSRVQAPRPSRPRGWWIFLVPLVVLAIVIAFVVIAGGSNDDGVAVPAPSTTAAVSSITVAPSITAAPANSMPPVSGVAPPPVSLPSSDEWGTASRWTLVTFDSVTLSLLDLGTGKTESFSYGPDGFGYATRSLIAFSDRFVFTEHDGTWSVRSQRYRDEPSTLVLDHASILTTSASPGLFWVALDPDGVNGEQRVAEIDQSGRVVTTLSVPTGLRVLGAGPTGLWLSGSGRIYSLDRDGRLIAKEVGSVVDVSALGVLFDDCAIAGPCTLRLTGAAGATSRRIGPSAEMRVASASNKTDPALSPDGRWLLLADSLLDRQTGGQVTHSFDLRTWRWSPDGEWLFLVTTGSGALAWNLADGRQIAFARLGDLSGVVAR